MCGFIYGLFILFHGSIYVLMPVLHCFDHCSFVLSFKIKKCESSKFVLFQYCFGYSGYLAFLYELSLPFKKGRGPRPCFMDDFCKTLKEQIAFLFYLFENYFFNFGTREADLLREYFIKKIFF